MDNNGEPLCCYNIMKPSRLLLIVPLPTSAFLSLEVNARKKKKPQNNHATLPVWAEAPLVGVFNISVDEIAET